MIHPGKIQACTFSSAFMAGPGLMSSRPLVDRATACDRRSAAAEEESAI